MKTSYLKHILSTFLCHIWSVNINKINSIHFGSCCDLALYKWNWIWLNFTQLNWNVAYNYTFQQVYYIAFLSVFCENTKLCNRELVCPSSPYCIFDERLLTSFQVSNLGLAAMVVNFQMLLTSYLFPFIPVWSLQLSFHCLGIMSFSLGLDWRHILEGY